MYVKYCCAIMYRYFETLKITLWHPDQDSKPVPKHQPRRHRHDLNLSAENHLVLPVSPLPGIHPAHLRAAEETEASDATMRPIADTDCNELQHSGH